jgi:hypothetical protein
MLSGISKGEFHVISRCEVNENEVFISNLESKKSLKRVKSDGDIDYNNNDLTDNNLFKFQDVYDKDQLRTTPKTNCVKCSNLINIPYLSLEELRDSKLDYLYILNYRIHDEIVSCLQQCLISLEFLEDPCGEYELDEIYEYTNILYFPENEYGMIYGYIIPVEDSDNFYIYELYTIKEKGKGFISFPFSTNFQDGVSIFNNMEDAIFELAMCFGECNDHPRCIINNL